MKEKTIERLVNALVVVVMVVVANYPLYTSLKATANDVNEIIVNVREEIAMWKNEVENTQVKLEEVRREIVNTIDDGINSTNNVLNKVDKIDSDINELLDKIETIKFDASDKIDKIKDDPSDALKNLLKLKG